MNVAEIIQAALSNHRAGRLAQAEQLYRQVLAHTPDQPDALHYLGIIAAQSGHLDDGLRSVERAAALRPQSGEIRANLGALLQQKGLMPEAIASFREAVRLNPQFPDAHNMLGAALYLARDLPGAIACFREALRLQPDFPPALSNLGAALNDMGQTKRALECSRRLLTLVPLSAEANANMGVALGEMKQWEESATYLQRAVELNPRYAQAWTLLGQVRQMQGRADDAEMCHRTALDLEPRAGAAHANLANVLLDQGRVDDGIAEYRRAMELEPDNARMHSNYLIMLNYNDLEPQELLEQHVEWSRRHERPLGHLGRPHDNDRDPDRRLRIGYVSLFYGGNPINYFLQPILANHDHERFHVVDYSTAHRRDAATEEFAAYADQARNIATISDDALAEMIRGDRIDILVDLLGHMGQNRLPVFARKPAPVQVSYLGHCATTGMSAMDYRISDAIADPPGESNRYSEELVRLASGFCCYAPPANAPEVSPLPALTSGRVTFGSLHKLDKLSPQVIDLWCELLSRVANSRLLIFRDTLRDRTAERFRAMFAQRGIAADRVELRCDAPADGYLGVYRDIDVSLDAFPWSGHTTVCESCRMGVPMVTLSGRTYIARMVASVLTQIGLTDFIAHTPQEYVAIAAQMAGNLPRLTALREQLRPRMAASQFCIGQAVTRDLEAALRQMWIRWCESTEK